MAALIKVRALILYYIYSKVRKTMPDYIDGIFYS